MDSRELFEWARARLKKHLKTERAVAQALGLKPQTFNYQYVHAKNLLQPVTFKMFKLLFKLENKDSGYPGKDLAEAVLISLKAHLEQQDSSTKSPEPSKIPLDNRDYFKKLKQGVAEWDAKVAAERNAASKDPKKGLAIPNSEFRKQERYVFIIESQGLPGGKDKFYKAEKIRLEKREELMEAVASGLIRMHCAYQLLPFHKDRVAIKLAEGRKAVLDFLREQKGKIKNKIKEEGADEK